jgi:hypothetical protein
MSKNTKNPDDYCKTQSNTYSKDDTCETYYNQLRNVESMHDLHLLFKKMKSDFDKQTEDALKNADHWHKVSPAPEEPTWITTIDVIKNYPISRRKLQELRNNNRIPFSRIGRKCIYKPEDIEDFMTENYTKKKKAKDKTEK